MAEGARCFEITGGLVLPANRGQYGSTSGQLGTTMADENKRFVEEFANPHSWLLTADNLHEQAAAIYAGRAYSSIMTKVDANDLILRQTRGIDKSVFLLSGFALENAIKAFIVYENPNWVSNGRLSKNLRSHSLTTLQSKSKLIPYKTRYLWILEAFEDGLDSWFRYPCALTVEETKEEGRLYDHLWHGYSAVMRAYGRKISMLLGKGWIGPHGFYGRWVITGDHLGYKTRAVPKEYSQNKSVI
jgi:hypothetical protein